MRFQKIISPSLLFTKEVIGDSYTIQNVIFEALSPSKRPRSYSLSIERSTSIIDTFPYVVDPDAEHPLVLHRTEQGLVLEKEKMSLRCDFLEMLPRIKPGKLQTELLVKAAKIKHKEPLSDSGIQSKNNIEQSKVTNERSLPAIPIAIDATAGLGQDSFLLAAAGFSVYMFEQDPIIAALLEDALNRAQSDPALANIVERMHLFTEDSISALQRLSISLSQDKQVQHASSTPNQETAEAFLSSQDQGNQTLDTSLFTNRPYLTVKPDVIYLDPMFPERTKSAAVKKKFQLLHHLEHPCENEEELLGAAMNIQPRKIVVKRMAKGPFLAGKKPSYSVKGKSIRYDCYVYA